MPAKNPAKQKRKRCENCNKLFEPKKPWSKFCKDECRKEFHRYGSSYGPLKTGLHKAIDKKYAELAKDSERRYKAFMSEMSDQSRRIDRVERGGSNFTIDSIKEAINRLAVEVAELRAKMDTDRGQIENHTHEVFEYTDYGTTRLETGQPRKC